MPKVKVPEGVHLFFLPGYSSELRPAERLWPLLREAVASENVASIDQLKDVFVRRCR